ncbi:MAG: OadG family protein [Bacillota bacterium]
MENLNFALQVSVLGFLVVMVTLSGLYGILLLFNRLLYQPVAPSTDSKIAEKTKPSQVKSFSEENERVIAAIIAAVYQYMQIEHAKAFTGSVNISVQPSGGVKGNRWKHNGRKELLENRLELENIKGNKKRKNFYSIC